MAVTTRGQRYSAGRKGRNRVCVFPDPKTGIFQIEWWENGGRLSRSLKHRDWGMATKQADQVASGLLEADHQGEKSPEPEPLSLAKLFDIYLGEVTPSKAPRTQKHDRAAAAMFLDFLGEARDPSTLSRRDWDRFIRERSAGRVGGLGMPVGPRTVGRDLLWLVAVLNWAVSAADEDGGRLLEQNSLRGYRAPAEKNPRRVSITEREYTALLAVASDIDWRFRVALVLAHETGHRIRAIRLLRWSDVDITEATVLWRAESEKTGYEHSTPLTPEAVTALEEARRRCQAIGDAPVFPAPKDPTRSASKDLMYSWWKKAEKLAGIEPEAGRGWHSLRRKFASDYKHLPPKVLADLGGWKTTRVILECYQTADEEELRSGLADRRRA